MSITTDPVATDRTTATSTVSTTPAVPRGVHPGRWPLLGIAAGVTSFAATVLHAPFIDDPAVIAGGPEAVFAELSTGRLQTQLGAGLGYLSAVLLVGFGIGLVRTMLRRVPNQTDLVAALGVTLVAGIATLVSGFTMKSVLASGMPGGIDEAFYTKVDVAVASTFAGQLQFAGFLPLVAAIGVTALLVLRHGAMQRWIGVLSALMAVAVAVVTVALNLPWSSGLVTPIWLVAVSVAALRLRRRDA